VDWLLARSPDDGHNCCLRWYRYPTETTIDSLLRLSTCWAEDYGRSSCDRRGSTMKARGRVSGVQSYAGVIRLVMYSVRGEDRNMNPSLDSIVDDTGTSLKQDYYIH
jgi:hypothetical protein